MGKQSAKSERYDTQMIEDFLHHLLWEVRIAHHEATNPGAKVNPELVDQLAKYTGKYHCVLLPIMKIDDTGVSKQELEQVVNEMCGVNAKVHGEWLEHLEALRGLFSTAIDCAKHDVHGSGTVPVRTVKASEIFEDNKEDGS